MLFTLPPLMSCVKTAVKILRFLVCSLRFIKQYATLNLYSILYIRAALPGAVPPGLFKKYCEERNMKNGFIKTAACSPALRVADCNYNAEKIIEAMQAHANVQLLVFPEFSLTGYTCGDLFLQHTLLQGAEAALEKVIAAFQQQLDSLFENDVVDITAEIRVMEKMMASEGLAGTNDFK